MLIASRKGGSARAWRLMARQTRALLQGGGEIFFRDATSRAGARDVVSCPRKVADQPNFLPGMMPKVTRRLPVRVQTGAMDLLEKAMLPLAQADELAQLRAQIARLKAREGALVAALIAAPEIARMGRWTRADLVERRLRLFDHRLLPAAIRDDPLLWRERVVTEVECHDLAPASLATGSARSAIHPLQ